MSSCQTDDPSGTNPFPVSKFDVDPDPELAPIPGPDPESETLGLEKVVFLKEKLPNWGVKRREKVGFGEENEKWAANIRGEWFGEPKRPRPDFRERERGGERVGVAVGE